MKLEPWSPRAWGEVLAERAAERPAAEAFVCLEARLNWRALWQRAQARAGALAALGIGPGDRVALCLPNGAAWIELFYGASLLGAVTVPFNTRWKDTEIDYALRQADIVALIGVERFLSQDFAGMFGRLDRAGLPKLRHVLLDPDRVLGPPLAPRAIDPSRTGLIQYTSGTTAQPKGVMLSQDAMLRNAANVAHRLGARAEDRYYSARPFYHVAGTTLSILVALASGCTLLTAPVFEAEAALETMAREACTLTSGNDTLFLAMMNHPRFAEYRLSLRGGWAAAGPEVMRQIHHRMGMRDLCFAYGLSEAAPNVVLSAHDDPLADRIAGLARPHPGIELRIVAGEIRVRGWNLMQGYWAKPAETRAAFDEEGFLRTGDLGALDAQGRLRFIGRAKDVFRVGGENVAPAEIEEVLHRHPAVKQAQVVGVPDARLGEVAAAYVVANPGHAVTADDLIAHCRAACANFRVPRYLRLVEGFEGIGMTGSAKVQKTKLRAQALVDFGLRDKG
ncbi:MAG: AMP-binding protein [Alphaproteobacteria bacterium]|nr:AMP-binding protein [Alphaproteobacteria bacterium]